MKHGFIILLFLLVTCSHAFAQQERRTELYAGVTIERVMPTGWGSSIYSTVYVTNNKGEDIIHFKRLININEPIVIDVRDFPKGTYTITVKVKNSKDDTTEIITGFNKKQSFSRIELKFVYHCYLDPIPRLHSGTKGSMVDKPVIYLYPPETEDVCVQLDFKGKIEQTIPEYNKGWKVQAQPDGTIINYADGKAYPYLFWEGETYKMDWDMHNGFVVMSDSIRHFFETILPEMGLEPKEYNEFISYWLPRMTGKPYYFIHFAGTEYEDIAALNITPKPEALLRVFMVFTPTYKNYKATPQHFKPFMRKGFTAVEWGGTQLGKSNIRENTGAYEE